METAFDTNGLASSNATLPVALFDASHGQPNWAQTGFPSRELHSNFAGLTEILCRLGFLCSSTGGCPLTPLLSNAKLLIIPPPTGYYDARRECWRWQRKALFTSEEVGAVQRFLQDGGRLLAFAYRFGDSFTQTNLGELFTPLGCQLDDDAVLDATTLHRTHPLQMYFDTPNDSLPWPWARAGVASVRWRPSATFRILSGATAWPLAFSPGGGCLSFNRTLRQISFASLPLAVVGQQGAGRFALFGGSHVFESSPLGLLGQANNTRFLRNTLHWLLADTPRQPLALAPSDLSLANESPAALTRIDGWGEGQRTFASVEGVLRKTGLLKALGRAKWMP